MAEHITIKREVLEEALYLIESWQRDCERADYVVEIGESVDALRTALEAKDVEPYCWLYKDDTGECQLFFGVPPEYSLPLYRHPAPDARKEKP
jgi:hypothetical protein